MSEWKEKLSCFTPNYIEHDVCGQQVKFWPVSVGLTFELRRIGKPLAKSLSVLFSKNANDNGTQDLIEKDERGNDRRELTILPISEGLAKIRHEQQTEAIEGLVESLTNPEHAEIVGKLLMDSLREVFPREEKKDWPPVQVFIKELPLPALGAMLAGLAMANQEVLGPLTETVKAKVGEVVTASNRPSDEEMAEPLPISG
jgi:hypothetical protein